MAQELAAFVVRASWDGISPEARQALKARVLDAIGCALGALGRGPLRAVWAQTEEFGGRPLCTLIGGGRTAPDRAAFANGAAVRYLDYNDAYLATGETCHPSDNVAPVLAAAEYAGVGGRDLLTALAVAYQVQCRLSDVAPVRAHGFDHTTQGAYAVAAGVARALDLDQAATANAVAIAGTSLNALRVSRTGLLSHWKGLAYPATAFGSVHAAFLAKRGITGPPEVFEGNKGFMDAIAGPFRLDWATEDLERVRQTITKRFNAEIHSQSALEGILELRAAAALRPETVERVDVDIFDVAFNIIGGGEEGEKRTVRTKEQADHSLPYMLAVALLDGEVGPAQYRPERIRRPDVQRLLRRVAIRPDPALSAAFPAQMPCRLAVSTSEGRVYRIAKQDYEGFHTRPAGWPVLRAKFAALGRRIDQGLAGEIADAIERLEQIAVTDLTALLARVRITEGADDDDGADL
jgi:2-methylcitrate dehydratase